MSKIIEVNNLYKEFNNEPVLQDVNFDVHKGEIFGIIGESGSGKSTLLRCLNGLLPVSSGSITTNHVHVNALSKKKLNAFRGDIGMIFQNFSLVDRLTVYENIALPLKIQKADRALISEKINAITQNLGIHNKLDSKPGALSGGQKQRVAIARALITNPRIILSDESTSALDPENTKALLDIFKNLNKELGVTIIIVSHEMDVIRYTCDRVLILHAGKVDNILTPEKLYMEQFFMGQHELGQTNILNFAVYTNKQTRLLYELISKFGNQIDILNNQTETFKDTSISFYTITYQLSDLAALEVLFDKYQAIWKVI